ncbi:MAG: recombination mediator RecR [Paracoccaceae bacterium]|jgi:recombination protein RecR
MSDSAGKEIDQLISLMAKLPGLGPRSARRAVLQLVKKRTVLLEPLARSLTEVAETVRECAICGNVGTSDTCGICADPKRDTNVICVVSDVADLWAMERSLAFKGRYHVLGGVLSALDGIGPEGLQIPRLVTRVEKGGVSEVVLALSATIDGQTTAHYIADQLEGSGASVTSLAQGVPIGGELDYLDDGTITAALKARKTF